MEKANRDWCCFENNCEKQDWDSVFTKLHFRISPTTILVLHQAVPPHDTTKLRPCPLVYILRSDHPRFVQKCDYHNKKIMPISS